MNPAVSVIVPTVDRPVLLRAALESVMGQSLADWEAIVVDEGGHDETRAVVESFGDDRIILHRQLERVGMVENWGTGVRCARGEFLVLLADDDCLGPGFLEERIARLQPRPELLVAFSRFEVRRADSSLLRVQGGDWTTEVEFDGDGLLREALARRWFLGAALYRRDVVQRLWDRLRDDDLVLDLGLNVRLALTPGARGLALPVVDFVMLAHPAQNTEMLRDKVRTQTDETLRRIAGELGDDPRRRAVQSARANWLTVWGRDVAARGDVASGRRLLLRAVKTSPALTWPWRQLAVSLVCPRRLRGEAEETKPPR